MKHIFTIFLCAAAAISMVSCTGKADPDNTAGNGLEIKSSASFISVGGNDVAYLSVYYDGEDVTGSDDITVYIVEDGQTREYEDTQWSSEVECEVQFYAEWGEVVSPSITVAAVAGMTELPEDPHPDLYDDFVKKSFMVQGTSVGCQYCPYVIVALDEFYTMESYAEYASRAVLASAHANINVSDPMTCQASLMVLEAFRTAFSGFPSLMFDFNESIRLSSNATANSIRSLVATSLKTKASSAISAVVSGTESEGKVKVTAAVKVSEAGSYRIGAWLLEDGIEYFQYNSTDIELPQTIEHDNAVRAISSMDPVTGEYLGGNQTAEAGTLSEFSCEFDIDDAKVDNLANCHVVVFVTKQSGNGAGKYYIDNVIDCGINERVAFQYED